ncbi:amidohydrolase family protein [Kibdelosporangium lantanae]|uniref:Amidohydrolase family protein n=1 Tax=Kibdelosporangium lantanae TaxID=1497396 RepID=A0ABW3M2B6_9PSEU
MAGITATTTDPPGGEIQRADGEPTGLLLEGATVLMKGYQLTPEQHRRASQRAIEILHTYGVTAFQDAAVSTDIMGALKSLDGAGELDAWVVSSLLVNDPIFGFSPVGRELFEVASAYRSEHHRPDFVKIFLDGVPPTRTAAFLDPYLPDSAHGHDYHGSTTMSLEELTSWLRLAASYGLSAKVHCTGDASVRLLLDAVTLLRKEGLTAPRFQVAAQQGLAADEQLGRG